MTKSNISPAIEDGLYRALRDIALTQGVLPLLPTAGPSAWDFVKDDPKAFGPEHDFEVIVEGSVVIFDPVSKAALQWCYAHLPEDCMRWGKVGYVVEPRYIDDIIKGAKRDGLMSRQDYVEAMEENHNLSLQREPS